MGNPGEAEQDDGDGDEAVVIDDVALRAVEVALPHGEEDGGEKPGGDGDRMGEERPPAPLFVRKRHGFVGIEPEFEGSGADLQQGVVGERPSGRDALAVGVALFEAADGEALCALFDDGVVVGDKGRLDDDVVVFGAADAHWVGVDAVDVVLVFDG